MNTPLLIIIIVAAVMALGVGSVFFAKKFGSNYIGIAQSLVSIIKAKMDEYNFGGENFDLASDFIIRALIYVQAMSEISTTIADKVSAAYSFIEDLLTEAGIKLDDSQAEIIKSILKGGFIFMDYIGLSAAKITVDNYVSFYDSTVKYSGGKVPPIVNLRKTLNK